VSVSNIFDDCFHVRAIYRDVKRHLPGINFRLKFLRIF